MVTKVHQSHPQCNNPLHKTDYGALTRPVPRALLSLFCRPFLALYLRSPSDIRPKGMFHKCPLEIATDDTKGK